MVFKIARKEFTEMWRDGRFRFVGAIVFLLLTAALLMGWSHYKDVSAQQAAARAFDERQWQEQGERNPHSAAHFGKYAFKPTPAVSFLDRGLNSYLGVAVWLEAHYQNPFRFRPVEDATVVQRFGELTAAVVLQLLIPLLIILLTFSTFAGERESGTLRQVLSLGVKPRDLAFGKALGAAGAVLVLLVPACVVGVLALALAASGTSADGIAANAGRFAVLTISYLLYFVAFLGVALAISAWSRAARTALIILFAFWILNGLLVPRAVADLAQKLHPAPSSTEFWDNIRKDMSEGVDGHDPQNKRLEAAKQQLLAQYNVARVEDLPINFAGWSLQQGEEYGNRVFDKRYGELWAIYDRQNRVYDFASIFAPLLAVRSVSMSMAGTDFNHHRHFSTEAEQYRRALNKLMNEDYMIHGAGKQTYNANETLWKNTPEFRYQLPSTSWAVETQVLPLVMLLVWAAGAIGLAWLAVKRIGID
jgi:ABC-2 type transport system permease protein